MSLSLTVLRFAGTNAGVFMAQTVKDLPALWEIRVWSLGQEHPLEKGGNGCPLQYPCLENSMDRGYCPWGLKESDTTKQLALSLSETLYWDPVTGSSWGRPSWPEPLKFYCSKMQGLLGRSPHQAVPHLPFVYVRETWKGALPDFEIYCFFRKEVPRHVYPSIIYTVKKLGKEKQRSTRGEW